MMININDCFDILRHKLLKAFYIESTRLAESSTCVFFFLILSIRNGLDCWIVCL